MAIRDNIIYRGRNELASQITPKVQVQDDIVSPSGEWVPASWLPVAFTKRDHQRGDAWIVISAGKVVALQRSPYGTGGRRPTIVPAGLAISLKPVAATSEVVLSYTSTDVEARTVDLVTGKYVTAPVSYTAKQVCDALIEQGLVSAKEVIAAGGTVPVASVADCELVIDAFISYPIGYVPYDVHAYAGFAEEGDQKYTNWREQAAVAVWTEGQLRLPQLVAEVTAEGFDLDAALPAVTGTIAAGDFPEAGEIWAADALAQLDRYAGVLTGSEDIYGIALSSTQLAVVTDRTPFSCSVPALVKTQVSGPEKVDASGKFAIDYDAGIVFVVASDLDSVPTDSSSGDDITFTYWAYDSAEAVHPRYALFAGECRPGDMITFDAHSNFTSAGRYSVANGVIPLGRVDDFEVWPKHLQQFRKSAWEINASGFDATSRTPGSATKGFPDAFTLPSVQSNIVADRFVIVHVRFL